MTDPINLAISIVALALSAASAAYTWLEHRKAARLRIRDEIIEAIASFDRYRTAYMAMSREREKTGESKEDFEQDAFNSFQKISQLYERLSNSLREHLDSGTYKKFDEAGLIELRCVKQSADSFTAKVEMFFDRFKRFNENRLPEMKEQLKSVHQLLESIQRG